MTTLRGFAAFGGGLATLALVACGGGGGDTVSAEAVREAAREHVEASGGRMEFEDPTRRGEKVALAFDHVHSGVATTEGGRQVVCVDFRSEDGTTYDVDFYVDRAETTEQLLVEDIVVHKVGDEDVPSASRRAELDRES
jgi:hypothetical protein